MHPSRPPLTSSTSKVICSNSVSFKRTSAYFNFSTTSRYRCGCGELLGGHTLSAPPSLTSASGQTAPPETEEHWSISRHTDVSPTNFFGTIEFQATYHTRLLCSTVC
ncbi:hypothetical protein HPB48_013920 [Haemaphysalis longicornis]|uniref:Uncharacterized protein n=1 Tax=Haemaphysalis longicornis TaxID=44386 RepID=A0A9J6G4B5_HAELO|nr:hypothetical protein HPB48_013920 [Haemaphysalis longicornis]